MNKALKIILLISVINNLCHGQNSNKSLNNDGRFFVYWGWNQSVYSKSDISFAGENYNFSLENVIADDKPSPFKINIYLNPANATIPQYNFRLGYFINEKYSISLGADHMKYVVRPDQTVKISGQISQTLTQYDGQYDEKDIQIRRGFLELEHTDGLNYVNTELRRQDLLMRWEKVDIQLVSGAGLGILIPRTDATLLNFERHDKFHVAGFGLGGVLGLQFKFGNYFFIQSEYKSGYINMPDIRTTSSTSDVAKQDFLFHQFNILFGSYFGFKGKNSNVN